MARPKRRATKGTGQVYLPGGSRTWAIRYTVPGATPSRRYEGGFLTKDHAVEKLKVVTSEINLGVHRLDEKKASPFFREVTDAFFAARVENSTGREDRTRWARHLSPLLADRRLAEVDSVLIGGLIAELKGKTALDGAGRETGKKLTGATIERVLSLLSAFFKWAIREKHHSGINPVTSYLGSLHARERRRLHSSHDPKDTPFVKNKADIGRIYRALPSPVNRAYALSALAGLRPGEALALEWGDVDLGRGQITVRRQVRNGKVGLPKSGKPRTIDVVPSLLNELAAWAPGAPDVPVVTPPRGAKHIGPKAVADALKAALEELGLPALTYYQAGRHTMASHWVQSGLDVYRLSSIMGHGSVTVTARYAHLMETPRDVLARADIAI